MGCLCFRRGGAGSHGVSPSLEAEDAQPEIWHVDETGACSPAKIGVPPVEASSSERHETPQPTPDEAGPPAGQVRRLASSLLGERDLEPAHSFRSCCGQAPTGKKKATRSVRQSIMHIFESKSATVMSPMGGLSQTVAPAPFALNNSLSHRTLEADRFNPCAGQDEAPYSPGRGPINAPLRHAQSTDA